MDRNSLLKLLSKLTYPNGITGCWLWDAVDTVRGYGRMHVNGKRMTVHRLMYLHVHGTLPVVVRHTCDNPLCCNPTHLIGGTQADNMEDMAKRGRSGNSKLSPEQVADIRTKRLNQPQYAKLYGISQAAISNIQQNKVYRHLTP